MASIFASANVSATSDPGGRRNDRSAADKAGSVSSSEAETSSESRLASRDPRSEYRLLWCLPAATTWCALGGVRDEDDIGCRTSSISARVPCAPRASTPCARCHSASHASPPTAPPSPRCSRSRGARISRASPVRSSRVAREDNARKTNSATHANDTSALRFRPHIRRAWRVPRPMCPAASIATRGSPTRHPAPRALGEPGFRGSHPRTPRSRRRLIDRPTRARP